MENECFLFCYPQKKEIKENWSKISRVIVHSFHFADF
jgi:hypothetical protein